jgi:uncharacterized protein
MDDLPPARGAKPCPICGKPAVARFRPFCSARCRFVDLGRWLDGTYHVPAVQNEDDERAEDADENGDAPG